METNLVSIGIPTYNKSNYLKEAIQSVLNQTYQNYEIVIVDDCSTDNTKEIVESFKDKRIQYYKLENNLRPPRSWNECVKFSKGKFFAILPHDDFYEPDFIKKTIQEFEENGEVGFVQCAYTAVDSERSFLEHRKLIDKKKYMIGEDAIFIQIDKLYCNPASIMFRKKTIIEKGYWKINFWDDWALILSIAYTYGCIYLPENLSNVRDHEENLSKKLTREGRNGVFDILNQISYMLSNSLPFTLKTLKLQSKIYRNLSYSCTLTGVKKLIRLDLNNSIFYFQISTALYPLTFIDIRFYISTVIKFIKILKINIRR